MDNTSIPGAFRRRVEGVEMSFLGLGKKAEKVGIGLIEQVLEKKFEYLIV